MSKPVEHKRAEEILAKLVSYDTTSAKPNRAFIHFVRAFLDNLGAQSEVVSDIVSDNGGGKACLWATVGQGEGGVVLAGHSDVVPVTGQTWTADPFKLDERDGRLYARGAADMKGFIACALAFAEEFVARKAPGCFHIALTHDEETDMSGAMRLTDYLSAQGVVPAWIWIGEPTGHKIVTQHKGVAAFQTRITGVPGHSSQPDRGLNAIELGSAYMRFVQQAAEARRQAPISPSPFDPPYTTFNLGKVSGGTAENIIAETFDLLWQVRVHPGDRAADIAAAVDAEARAVFAPRFAAFPQTGFSTRACFDIPPFLATADNPGEKALKSCLHCAESTAVGFATEAGIFQKLGAAAVICGPGFIEQAHQGDEFIDKNQLAACVDLMRGVLLSSPTRAR